MSAAEALFFFPALIVALTVHEFAHAWSASLLGDDYARRQGRVSLWPGRHLSLMGTLAFFVLHFGWGKPVPVNLYNFKRPNRDYLLCSLAGPGANVLTIGVCFALMLLTQRTFCFGPGGAVWMDRAHKMLGLLALISAILAVINMLPVPPLDGSKIWPCVIPGLKPTLKPRTTWLFIGLLVFMIYTDTLDPVFRGAVKGISAVMPVSERERRARQVVDLYKQGEAEMDEGTKLADKGQDDRAKVAWTRANDLFSRALEIDPEEAELYYRRSHARWRLDRAKDALADIERAIDKDPNYPIYNKWRADLLKYPDRPDKARRDREKAKALRRAAGPDDAPVTRPTTAPTRPAGRTTRPRDNHAENQ